MDVKMSLTFCPIEPHFLVLMMIFWKLNQILTWKVKHSSPFHPNFLKVVFFYDHLNYTTLRFCLKTLTSKNLQWRVWFVVKNTAIWLDWAEIFDQVRFDHLPQYYTIYDSFWTSWVLQFPTSTDPAHIFSMVLMVMIFSKLDKKCFKWLNRYRIRRQLVIVVTSS